MRGSGHQAARPDAARPTRSVQARKPPQTEGDALGGGPTKVFRPPPPPSVFWVVSDGGGTWGAHGRKVALPPCRAAPLGCSATTLGACSIVPYQNVPTNAETQRSYPDFFVRRKRGLGKAETCPSSSHRSSFQPAPPRTSLQSTSTLPFAAHVCSSLEPHFEPFSRTSLPCANIGSG
jgi:hypothetical protein